MKKTKYTTKWIKALRSGKYKQAQRTLRRRKGSGACYCCLGVACEIYLHGKWDGEVYLLAGAGSLHVLGDNLRRSYGMAAGEQRELAIINDTGASFEQIADIIEKSISTGIEITRSDF